MEIRHSFRSVVRENDFIEVGECQDGTTSWFSKASGNMRLCVDGVTNSATVFWANSPGQLASKTFRTVNSLQEWCFPLCSPLMLNEPEACPTCAKPVLMLVQENESENTCFDCWLKLNAVDSN
jgi:hypothetical protein